jgi:hypothetical protein
MSFTNCRRGQYKPRAIFFIFFVEVMPWVHLTAWS